MRLFYDEHIAPTATTHTLSEEESKHIVRVLRLEKGQEIGILDGKGRLFTCEINDAHPKRCMLNIVNIDLAEALPHEIHIAVGPTKQMERIEWFVEKATEIGITEISLIDCDNGERAKINIDRLVKKAVSAMKQSHRTFLPKINELQKLSDFIEANPNGLIAHCYENEKNDFSDVFESTNCPILIGPEGDFSQKEIEKALENGYKTITLGPNRLRTETAALYACMQAKLITK
jgi:16S rRNA (uracil1498-N3)-methyltransferase